MVFSIEYQVTCTAAGCNITINKSTCMLTLPAGNKFSDKPTQLCCENRVVL